MTNTIEVETEVGTFRMVRPNAGIRNRALAKAEFAPGKIKETIFMMEIVPKCVNKRPESIDQDVPITQILDSLTHEDYDKLFDAISEDVDDIGLAEEKKKKLEPM